LVGANGNCIDDNLNGRASYGLLIIVNDRSGQVFTVPPYAPEIAFPAFLVSMARYEQATEATINKPNESDLPNAGRGPRPQ
jgi:hypothetical protein